MAPSSVYPAPPTCSPISSMARPVRRHPGRDLVLERPLHDVDPHRHHPRRSLRPNARAASGRPSDFGRSTRRCGGCPRSGRSEAALAARSAHIHRDGRERACSPRCSNRPTYDATERHRYPTSCRSLLHGGRAPRLGHPDPRPAVRGEGREGAAQPWTGAEDGPVSSGRDSSGFTA